MSSMKKFKHNDFRLHYMEQTRIVSYTNTIDDYSIVKTIETLDYLSNLSNKPIILKLCSGGGYVDAGIVLYDYIKSNKVSVYTYCIGMCASMAAVILAAGKKRFITKNSRVMIHQPSSGCIGKATDIEIHAKETARIKKLINTMLSEDTGQSFAKVVKDTEVDKWMTAEEAISYGLVDKII